MNTVKIKPVIGKIVHVKQKEWAEILPDKAQLQNKIPKVEYKPVPKHLLKRR